MQNEELPISKISEFLESAYRAGCYSKPQVRNLESAYQIVLRQVGQLADPNEEGGTTVGEVRDNLGRIFEIYQAQSNASSKTLQAYQSRVERLINDFIRWQGTDLAAWKEKLKAQQASSATRKSAGQKGDERGESTPRTELPPEQRHRLALPDGRSAELRLPEELSSQDVELLWHQLESLKSFVQAVVQAKEATNSH